MSWKSPYPNHRYTEGLSDVKKSYAGKRKKVETSDSHPPDTEQGPSATSGFVGSNPSFDADVHSSLKMNPTFSVGDRRASPESDPDFERTKKPRYPRHCGF